MVSPCGSHPTSLAVQDSTLPLPVAQCRARACLGRAWPRMWSWSVVPPPGFVRERSYLCPGRALQPATLLTAVWLRVSNAGSSRVGTSITTKDQFPDSFILSHPKDSLSESGKHGPGNCWFWNYLEDCFKCRLPGPDLAAVLVWKGVRVRAGCLHSSQAPLAVQCPGIILMLNLNFSGWAVSQPGPWMTRF